MKIGQQFNFHFGKDIWVTYLVWEISETTETAVLITGDNYCGCRKKIRVKLDDLKKKKVNDWTELDEKNYEGW